MAILPYLSESSSYLSFSRTLYAILQALADHEVVSATQRTTPAPAMASGVALNLGPSRQDVGEAVRVDAPSGYRHDAQQGYMDSSMRGGQKEGSWLREDAQHLRLGVAFLLNGSWQRQ